MSDALFDADVYGPQRTARRRVKRPDEIRLAKPWVLLHHHNGPPRAHLLADGLKATDRDQVAARNGAVRARCGKYGAPIDIDGHPMAFVCHACWELKK